MDMNEVGCDAGYWINFTEDRVQWQAYVRAITYLWVA